MNLHEIEQQIEKMTPEQKQAFLDSEIPEELAKEAAAEVAQADLENALYAYGMMTCDQEIELGEAGEDGLSKEASDEFAAAETEISALIEQGVVELGLDQIEDSAELHKVAMANAALIFEGYCDQLEKVAKAGKKMKGILAAAKKHARGLGEKAKSLGHLAKKHPGKAGMIAAGTAAAGYGAHKMMGKKASELTADEQADYTLEKQATLEIVADGIEKLAAHGKGKGAALMKHLHGLKAMGKKHGKHMAGAAAGGGAAGYMASRMSRKEK
jgi:hypothetical protein